MIVESCNLLFWIRIALTVVRDLLVVLDRHCIGMGIKVSMGLSLVVVAPSLSIFDNLEIELSARRISRV